MNVANALARLAQSSKCICLVIKPHRVTFEGRFVFHAYGCMHLKATSAQNDHGEVAQIIAKLLMLP